MGIRYQISRYFDITSTVHQKAMKMPMIHDFTVKRCLLCIECLIFPVKAYVVSLVKIKCCGVFIKINKKQIFNLQFFKMCICNKQWNKYTYKYDISFYISMTALKCRIPLVFQHKLVGALLTSYHSPLGI